MDGGRQDNGIVTLLQKASTTDSFGGMLERGKTTKFGQGKARGIRRDSRGGRARLFMMPHASRIGEPGS